MEAASAKSVSCLCRQRGLRKSALIAARIASQAAGLAGLNLLKAPSAALV